MNNERDAQRNCRETASKYIDAGDPLGWFEALYFRAATDTSIIPWAGLAPNPNVVEWLDHQGSNLSGLVRNPVKVGSGLGDDAGEVEIFQRHGFVQILFEDYLENEAPPVRRIRVTYRRE